MDFFTQNLPMIDATNAVERKMQADTLKSDGNSRTYSYAAKFVRQLRNEAIIDVEQENMKDGAFGIDTLAVTKKDNTSQTVTVTRHFDGEYSYVYDYPLFRQNEVYTMVIRVKERYLNVDTKKYVEEVPQDAEVHISNEASKSTYVAVEESNENGEHFHVSKVYQVNDFVVPAGPSGIVEYTWKAGFPNTENEHLRNLSISVNVDGRTTMWKAPNKVHPENTALEAIILGGILSGNKLCDGSTGSCGYDSQTTARQQELFINGHRLYLQHL